MARFLQALQSGRVLLMDGAMGTELQRAGLSPGGCGELWNLDHPGRVQAIHRAYVDAGAECLLTNTFQANPPALTRHGAGPLLERICRAALDLARAAVGPDGFVLADVGPILIAPGYTESVDPDLLAAVVRPLTTPTPAGATADGLLLETFSTPAILSAVRPLCQRLSVPVLLSLTYRRLPDGSLQTWSGDPPEVYARAARAAGVAALGVNCGRDIGLEDICAIVRRYRQLTDLPLFARPNAGTPTRAGERWVYPLTAEGMAGGLPALLEAGVSLVGGCCGTTPRHIAALRAVTDFRPGSTCT
jgi:5-methyltetrahydrofolate--homocysteine methyltransferase